MLFLNINVIFKLDNPFISNTILKRKFLLHLSLITLKLSIVTFNIKNLDLLKSVFFQC